MRKLSRILSCAVLAWGLSACGVANSENILTADIYPVFQVIANSSNAATCRAYFRNGSDVGSDISLSGGDTVSCSDGSTTVQMTEDSQLFASAVEYSGTGLRYGTDVSYSFTFTRPKSNETFTSTVTLPSAVTISSPAAVFKIKKGDPIFVAWVGGTSNGVIVTVTHELATGGTSTFSSSTISESPTASGQYVFRDYSITRTGLVAATIRVTRDRDGSQDVKWGGRGKISASQFAEVVGQFSDTAFRIKE